MPSSTPLLSPREYFETHDNALSHGLGVFALYVLVSIVGVYAMARLLLAHAPNVPDAAVRAVNDLVFATALLTVLIAIVSLLVVAGIMHYWCKDSYHVTFGSAVAVAAWSYAPDLIAVPIQYAIARYRLSGRTFDATDPAQFSAELEALQATTGLFEILIAVAVVAWSVFILVRGFAVTHDAEDPLTPAVIIGLGALVLRLVALA